MKPFASYILYALLASAIVCACNDNLDIKQDYWYSIEILPLPKSIKQGQTVALEFSIIREGYYTGTSYRFRYFQSEGEETLKNDKGKTLPMNLFHAIASDNFVLNYQCDSEEQQQLDFVFEDNFGQRVEYTVKFTGARTDEDTEIDTEGGRRG